MVSITEPFVLPEDVVVVKGDELAEPLRASLDIADGSVALTRHMSRAPSKLLESDFASLVARFRDPQTIVDAIIDYAKDTGGDPNTLLEQAFPVLRSLIQDRFLVAAHGDVGVDLAAPLTSGARVGSWTIEHCVQVVDDSEVHRATDQEGNPAVLKLVRQDDDGQATACHEREATILEYLAGEGAPELLDRGLYDGRPYLAASWCDGVPVTEAANLIRGRDDRQLLDLATRIASSYDALHRRGVVHGDVHPRNVLVTRDDGIVIIDYGFASWDGLASSIAVPPRAGIGYFLEPEYVLAREAHRRPPPATEASDQYALAALLYLVFTGAHYLEFVPTKVASRRQIAHEPPLPFVDRGVPSWPDVERVIAVGLAKEPSARHSSVGALAANLKRASHRPSSRAAMRHPSRQVLDEFLTRAAGPLLRQEAWSGPSCSVNFGGAGVAYALYRMALVRDSPELLSLADVWLQRTKRRLPAFGAFHVDEMDLRRDVVGDVSPYNALPGVYAVEALIAAAMGDLVSHREAVSSFIDCSRRPCDQLDLTLGVSGTTLAASLLIEALPAGSLSDAAALQQLGADSLTRVWQEVGQDAVAASRKVPFLGIAHGWAGLIYAALRWKIATTRSAVSVMPHLQELAECAVEAGHGLRWPRRSRQLEPDYLAGWCNGSAGFVHLWLLAARVDPSSGFEALAERAGIDMWTARETAANLCCGTGGRAYAALALYRGGLGEVWLGRARELAARDAAVTDKIGFPNSLYKGQLGTALLSAELEVPEQARMPFFEPEF